MHVLYSHRTGIQVSMLQISAWRFRGQCSSDCRRTNLQPKALNVEWEAPREISTIILSHLVLEQVCTDCWIDPVGRVPT